MPRVAAHRYSQKTTAQAVSRNERNGATKIYLPQIARATQATLPPTNPFINPDFEQGQGVGWIENSSNNFTLVTNTDLPTGVTPHSGQWLAWVGGEMNEIGSIRQTVTVPADATTLRYWQWIRSNSPSNDPLVGDVVLVALEDATVLDNYMLSQTTATNGWVEHRVDLSALAGTQIELVVQVQTRDFASDLLLDDFSFTNQTNVGRASVVPESSASLVQMSAASKMGVPQRAEHTAAR
jgi:hypothetical protein